VLTGVLIATAGVPGLGGQPQAPSFPELIRIDEVRAVADVPAEIEPGERGPICAVPELRCRNAPERVARLDRIGTRRHPQRVRRSTSTGPTGQRRRRRNGCMGDRHAGARPGGHREGRADARQGEHTERNSCRHTVEHRRAAAQADLAGAHMGHDGTEELRAAGGPGHPGRQDETAQRRLGERSPVVPEASAQRVPDDHDKHDRDGGEREKGRAGGADDVDDPPGPGEARKRRATHRRGRWRWCTSARSSPSWAR
jgi:hypothetical protein